MQYTRPGPSGGVCPPPADCAEGRITAGNASQVSDGSAAVLICNEEGLKKLGVEPLAIVRSLALAGDDPVTMLDAPIPATRTALEAFPRLRLALQAAARA